MTGQTATTLVRDAYAAFNSKDVEAGIALMSDDVVWPHVPDGGFVHGREAVRTHWREQFEAIDPHIELLEIDADADGTVRASVRQTVRSHEGTTLSDDRVTHVYAIRDGLIQRMEPAG